MQPLRFAPIIKRIPWGGNQLGTVLGKKIGPEADYAESWEICDHGHDQSVVTHGPEQGWTLQRLVQERGPELLGRHAGRSQFPLLFKFLDAQARLSLQVHPNDTQARHFNPVENGKTEAWLIIAAEPKGQVFAGFKPGVTSADLEQALQTQTVESLLHAVPVTAGDCLFIPAGTVHAICDGVLLAEVQQSSDLTFRLYDWGRLGNDGKPRQLHIEQSFNCIDFTRGPVNKATPAKVESGDHDVEELVRCSYFIMRRHKTAKPFTLETDNRFHVLMVLQGSVQIESGSTTEDLPLGNSILIPASAPTTKIIPTTNSIILQAFLP